MFIVINSKNIRGKYIKWHIINDEDHGKPTQGF